MKGFRVQSITFSFCFWSVLITIQSYCFMFNGFEVRDLENNDQSFLDEIALWASSGINPSGTNYSLCENTYFLGGFNILPFDGSFTRKYENVPPHNVIYYSMTFQVLDLWTEADTVLIYIEQISQTFLGSSNQGTQNLCGSKSPLDFGLVKLRGRVPHQKSSVTLLFVNKISATEESGSFGFRAINLLFRNESQASLKTPYLCSDEDLFLFSKCSCKEHEYMLPTGICSPCHETCETCFGGLETQCSKCKPGYYFDGQGCITCHSACSICYGKTQDMCNTCSQGYYLKGGHICEETCDTPFISRPQRSYFLCESPCSSTAILFCKNDSCIPLNQCNLPYTKNDYEWYSKCEPICSNLEDYVYTNGSCLTDCPGPFQKRVEEGLLICDPPLCQGQACQTCNPVQDCSINHYCDESIGYCLPSASIKLQIDLIKHFLNGYTLTVKVNPPYKANIDVSDTLSVSFPSHSVAANIKCTIIRIEKGVFLVLLEIINDLPQEILTIDFTYSTPTTTVTATQDLSKPIYITPALQTATKIVQTSTYITSAIYAINMIGLFLIGELTSMWSIFPENQYPYYLLYLNVDYLHHTKIFFKSLANLDLLFIRDYPEIDPKDLNLELKKSLPIGFLDKDYTYNIFENLGPLLVITAGVTALLILSSALLRCLRFPYKARWIYNGLKIIRSSIRWNGIISQIVSYSLPIVLASLVQFHISLLRRDQSTYALMVAVILLLAFMICLKKMFNTINRIPKSKFERVIYSMKYGVLWEGLNGSTHSKFFHWLLVLRGYLMSYLCVFLDFFPNVQIGLLAIYQFFILAFYFKGFRFNAIYNNPFINVVGFIRETSIFLMKLMIIAFLNVKGMGDNFSIFLGWMIIFPGLIGHVSRVLLLTTLEFKEKKRIFLKARSLMRQLCRKRIIKKIKKIQPQMQRI